MVYGKKMAKDRLGRLKMGRVKYQKMISKEYDKGKDYKFLAFKYGVSQPDTLRAVEQDREEKAIKKRFGLK